MLDPYIEQYGRRLYGLCLSLCRSRLDAEDLYQDTWLRALARFHRYDPAQPFGPWLTRICLNRYRDLRRRQKRCPVTDGFADASEKERFLEQTAAPEREDLSHVRAAVDALPEKLRQAVILFYFHQLDLRQTARALGVPEGTAKSRLSRAREKLKEVLRDADALPF